jgi:hypothetical protein
MRRPAAVWWGLLMTAAVFAVSVLVLVGLESLPKGSSTSKPKAHSERLLQPKEIQGVLCTTRAWYKPDGKLSACRARLREVSPAGGGDRPELSPLTAVYPDRWIPP